MSSMEQMTYRTQAWFVAELFLLTFMISLWSNPQGALAQWATSGNDIHNTNTGNVGIGTTGPSEKVEILSDTLHDIGFGTVTAGKVGVLGWRNTAAAPVPGLFSNSASYRLALGANRMEHVTISTTGNVGIGTTSPLTKLHVDEGELTVTRTAGQGAGVVGTLQILASSLASPVANRITFGTDGSGWQLRLGKNQGGTVTDIVTINDSGNVGIGTTTPTTKLHVTGDVTVTGNIAAKYQDVAEWVPASRSLTPGTVVVLDTKHTNRVTPSSLAYDTRVAGIVSDTPGLLLGEAGTDKIKVATTGRVKAKVDATRKPIQVGDLLVTSDKAGMAMASEPMELNGRNFISLAQLSAKPWSP